VSGDRLGTSGLIGAGDGQVHFLFRYSDYLVGKISGVALANLARLTESLVAVTCTNKDLSFSGFLAGRFRDRPVRAREGRSRSVLGKTLL
jgi:hypothetical protein